jgi:hypothetical protein
MKAMVYLLEGEKSELLFPPLFYISGRRRRNYTKLVH